VTVGVNEMKIRDVKMELEDLQYKEARQMLVQEWCDHATSQWW